MLSLSEETNIFCSMLLNATLILVVLRFVIVEVLGPYDNGKHSLYIHFFLKGHENI